MDKPVKKQEILEEMEALSPGLHGLLHRSQPDDLPFRYFDTLPDQVIEKITLTQENHKDWLSALSLIWTTRKRWVLAFASSLIIFVISSVYMIRYSSDMQQGLDFANIPAEEMHSYLLRHANELDEAQLNLLFPGVDRTDLINVSNDDLQPVIEDYLYQITDNDFN